MASVVDRAVGKPKVALLVVAGLVSVAGLAIWLQWTGPARHGATCRDEDDCDTYPAACMQDLTARYCTTRCDQVSDCPAGWSCGLAANSGESVTRRVLAGAGPGVSSDVTGMCVRP